MSTLRWDETWHRLREWTNDQGPSERLAAQVLLHEGYVGIDPSHPLGGRDGGGDAICTKDGKRWVMAVYFPRGQQPIGSIIDKFSHDLHGACANQAEGIAFVTNQELRLAERKSLVELASSMTAEIYHLERLATILDSPAMASVRKQFLGIDYDEPPTITLGGQGGLAPGAGGGGGGAIGAGAHGGDGGPGGKFIFMGSPGRAPGAGGGGEGVVGDNSHGGQGGGGGDHVVVEIGSDELQELRAAGLERLDLRVGKGGEAGAPGEDSIVNFVAADGTVLRSIVARGGRPGSPAKRDLGARQATAIDIESGLHVSSVLLAECAQLRHGLLYLLGAGWENFEFPTMPFEANWPLCCTISMGRLDPGTLIEFHAVVRDPEGLQVAKEVFVASKGAGGQVSRPNVLVPLRFTGSRDGVWTISIVSGGATLAQLPVEVKAPIASSYKQENGVGK